MGDAPRVDRVETPVFCVAGRDDIEAIRDAWARLEAVVPLHGRRFLGTCARGEYRACVEALPDDAFDLERGTVPGGPYVRLRLHGEPPALYDGIGPAVETLLARDDVDRSRPTLELYRRRDEVDVLVPVTP